MAIDTSGDLQKKVQRFTVELDPEKRQQLLREVLVLWTGTGSVVAGSRGNQVDATSLSIMESFWGQPALQDQPMGAYASSVNEAYIHLEQSVYSQLMASTHMRDLLSLTDFTEANGVWTANYSVVVDLFTNEFLAGNEFAALVMAEYVVTIRGLDVYSDSLCNSLITEIETAANLLPAQERSEMLAAIHSHDEIIVGSFIADLLEGFGGDDRINGGYGDDVLEGGDGDDRIYGDAGDDIIRGGTGMDYLQGGIGNDTYHYKLGDGGDIVKETRGIDSIVFGENIDSLDIHVVHSAGDLIINVSNGGYIIVNDFSDHNGRIGDGAVDRISFIDNEEWDIGEIILRSLKGSELNDQLYGYSLNDTIDASDGDDVIYGLSGNDNLTGGKGIDTIHGGDGDDSYLYRLGDGNDEITDTSGIDEITFGEGISPEDISLYRQGWYGLKIVLKDGGTILINNMFNSSDDVGPSAIEGIRFYDDAFWDSSQIKAKIIQNSITESNDIVEGFSSSDVIESGGGFDQLRGKGGDDRYIFNRGDGFDIITDTGGNDTLAFGPGIAPTDVVVHQSNGNFYFILNNGEMVQITGELIDGTPNETRLIERVEFAGGVVWDKTIIQQKIAETLANPNLLMGRDTWDHLYAGSNNSVLNGLDGNDQIYGGDGNDTLTGGGGLNFLDGGKGDDTYLITEQPAINFIEKFRDGFDRILFAEGIIPEDISVRLVPGRQESHLQSGVLWAYSFSQANDWNFEIKVGDSIVYLDSLLTSGALFGAKVKDPSLPSGEVEFFSGTKWDVYGLLQQAVKGTAVNDYITGTGNNDVIDGLAGNDLLQALDGEDTLDGGAGDDTLIGGYGKDVLIGGKGNDLLRGDNSSRDYSNLHESIDDVYRFNIGDGNDTIEEYFGRDTIEFGEGIAKESVIFTTVGNDIVVSFTNSTDSITIINGSVPEEKFYDGGKIEIFKFANGDLLNFDPKLDPVFREGTANSDTLVGGFGNDTFIGHEGYDDLRGDLGNDEYRYNLGDGFDYIDESGGIDKIVFGSSISPDMVQIKRSGFTFDIYVNNQKALSFGYGPWTGNHTLEGDPDSLVESLVFSNGDVWDLPTMVTKSLSFTSGNDVLYGTIADDVIDGGEGNDEIRAGSGNDTLIGGKDNDTLMGSIGDDEYHFEASDGADVIYDYGGNDSIVFGLGITPEDITINRFASDLTLKIKNANPITIAGFFNPSGGSVNSTSAIEKFIFANGDQLSVESLLEKISLLGTKNADTIAALYTDDYIDAKEGNDEVDGGDGNDTIIGGSGNDSLGGADGDDFLSGGIGNDVLYGGYDDDILEGGDGDDRLEDLYGDNIFEGGKGTDLIFTQYGNEGQGLGIATVRFGVGDGTDYLYGPANFNRIELGAGITEDSIFLKSQGKYAGGHSYQHENGFNLYIKGASDKLFGLIDNDQFEIVFSDSSVLKGAELSALVNKSIVRLSSDRQSIAGKSTPGIKIQVSYRNQDNSVTNYPELTADEHGNYSLNFGFGIKDISRISVIGLDSGSTVLPMTVFDPVTDTSTPSSPIAELDSSGYLISGFARPGTYVSAFGPDGYVGNGVRADLITGAFTINSYRRLNNGQSISVVASVNTLIKSAPTIITAPDAVPPVAPSGVFDSLGTSLSGSAEKGTIVSIMDLSGNVLGSSVANSETGVFVINFVQPIANGELIQMVARDSGGNTSPRYVRAPDVIAPTTVYASVDKTGKIIKGFAEPGATVVVRDTQGALLRQVTASAIDGAFEVTLSKVLTASQVVNIKVIDTAGNASTIIPVTAGSSDAPAQPQVAIDAQGRLVSGISTEAGTIIVRTTDNVELARTTVQAGTSFNITLANSYLNQEILSVSLQIAGGAESAPNYFMAPDKTAPAKPTAMFTSYNHSLQGFAEPGSTVQLLKEDNSVAASVIASGTNGSFTFLPGFTISETSRLSVVAIDRSGNVSSPLALIPYDSFKPIAPTANFNSSGKIVTGTAEPDTLVYIEKNISGSSNYSVIGFTRASINGTWVIELEESIIDGTNIYITSVDAGDNRSNVTITSPDLTAPLPVTAQIDSTGKIITGDAEWTENGGNQVIVMDATNTTVLGNAILGSYSGSYKITLPTALKNNEVVNIIVKDVAGNASTPTKINAPDKTPPAVPTASFDTTGKIVTGIAEAGSTVTVKNASGVEIKTAVAHETTGAYSIILNTALINKETVNVTAKDAAGNISSLRAIIAPDLTRPSTPSATFDSAGQVIAGTAEAGSMVSVTNAGGTVLKTATANTTTGAYSITLAAALINKETVNVTATDAAGNVSAIKAIIAPDKTAPTAPTAAIDTTRKIITGVAEAGSTVEVKNTSGTVLGSITANSTTGAYSITLGSALAINQTVNVTAKDMAGNISPVKAVVASGTTDTTPPEMPTASFDTTGKIVSGTAEAGSVVEVKNASGTLLGTVTAHATTGVYSITLATALINKENVKVTAKDTAGNISAIKTIIAPDKMAPAAPTATLDAIAKIVSGVAEAGSSVTVKDSAGQTLGVVQANATNGAYSVSFTQTLINGQSIFTTATDTAGNISAATATPIIINNSPSPVGNGLRGSYYGYHQPANGNVNLTNVAQVLGFIANKTPDATFVAKNFQYGAVAGANDLGMGNTLQKFLKTDAASLNVDPASTSDAILRFDGKIQLNAGNYNFRVNADDGYSIRVNGAVVAEYNANGAAVTRTHAAFTIVQSGLQDIEIVYWDSAGGNALNVELRDVAIGTYKYLDSSVLLTGNPVIPDTTPPESPSANFDPSGAIVSGIAEAGSVVEVKNTSGAVLGTVTAHATTGVYSITLATALINKESVHVTAKDTAGNISAIKAIIAPDKTAPEAPTATLDAAAKIVSGVAEAGSSVTVKDSAGQTLGVVQANATNGQYSITTTRALVNGESLFTTATDVAGNISTATTTPVVIAPPPAVLGGLRGSYYGYHQPSNGNVNLTNVAQVLGFIANKTPDATFVAKNFQYGAVAGANDLGMGNTLQKFLKTDAASLNVDPASTSDAILRFDGKIQLNAGSYNFRVNAYDGYSIRINGAVVAEYNANGAAVTRTHAAFTIAQSGLQDIEIVYWDSAGGNALNVELANTATGTYSYLNENILVQPAIVQSASLASVMEFTAEPNYEGVHYFNRNAALVQAMASFVSGSGVDARYRATYVEQSPLMIAVGS